MVSEVSQEGAGWEGRRGLPGPPQAWRLAGGKSLYARPSPNRRPEITRGSCSPETPPPGAPHSRAAPRPCCHERRDPVCGWPVWPLPSSVLPLAPAWHTAVTGARKWPSWVAQLLSLELFKGTVRPRDNGGTARARAGGLVTFSGGCTGRPGALLRPGKGPVGVGTTVASVQPWASSSQSLALPCQLVGGAPRGLGGVRSAPLSDLSTVSRARTPGTQSAGEGTSALGVAGGLGSWGWAGVARDGHGRRLRSSQGHRQGLREQMDQGRVPLPPPASRASPGEPPSSPRLGALRVSRRCTWRHSSPMVASPVASPGWARG